MEFKTAWGQAWAEYACDHERSEVRRFTASNGAVHFRLQCLQCGNYSRVVRKVSLSAEDMANLNDVNIGLHEAWRAAVEERAEQLVPEYAERRLEEWKAKRAVKDEEWQEWYAEYLRSPEWAHRRELVLARAGGLCEGCGLKVATQVHHTTYDHAGNELLFHEINARASEMEGAR